MGVCNQAAAVVDDPNMHMGSARNTEGVMEEAKCVTLPSTHKTKQWLTHETLYYYHRISTHSD
jgi:hypothetical protein